MSTRAIAELVSTIGPVTEPVLIPIVNVWSPSARLSFLGPMTNVPVFSPVRAIDPDVVPNEPAFVSIVQYKELLARIASVGDTVTLTVAVAPSSMVVGGVVKA